MNRTRKLAIGAAAAIVMAGGVALAAPALAQADPEPADQCPYECPYDGDQLRERMHERTGQQHHGSGMDGSDGSGGMGNMMERRGDGNGPGPGHGDGTCPMAPEAPDEGSSS